MTEIRVKHGATIRWACVKKDADGNVEDLTGATVTCTVENKRSAVRSNLSVSITDAANGMFELSATAAETAAWTVGLYKTDIRFVWPATDVSSSDVFNFQIVETVTDGS